MILSVKVPDSVYEKYAEHDPNQPQRALSRQLERFQDISPSERVLLFPADVRKKLETLYEKPIEDLSEFVRWVELLKSVRLGEIEVQLREDQLKRADATAKFYQTSTKDWIQERLRMAIGAAV